MYSVLQSNITVNLNKSVVQNADASLYFIANKWQSLCLKIEVNLQKRKL